MSKKLFIIDTLKTISSSLLIALGLQFISYPFIHRILGDKEFGQILTIYTIITISSVVLGNTLNNIRLINVNYYSADYYYSKFRKVLHI
ncbi:capsular biosynthesis protein, partial [Staphylococcus haemolyticus]